MSGKKLLEFSARAIRDVAGIEAYIMADNPSAAKKVVAVIYSASEQLETNPMLGHGGSNPGTRELVLTRYPYTIAYRLTAHKIRILTVLHQSRQYP